MRTFYPVLRYSDAHAAIAFLVDAFGFETKELNESADGVVQHAQLVFGDGMVMLGQSGKPPQPLPAEDDFRVYAYVADPDAHHDRSVAAGARVVYPLTDQPYGSREYGVRDSEGNVWTFGTYRP
jgi:uncharacterized glyoxalase superfamily protein PhnB